MEIVIIDDHQALLLGIKNFLQSEGFCVEDTFSNLQEAQALLQDELRTSASQFIILCDLQFGKEFSFDFIKKLSEAKIKCIVYSMYESEYFMLKAFDAGAWGYCFKSEDLKNLTEAIKSVESGKRYISKNVSADFINATSIYSGFTKKERGILDLIMQEKSNKEIAEVLGISYRTVESYLQRLYTKANVNSRFELERLLCKK